MTTYPMKLTCTKCGATDEGKLHVEDSKPLEGVIDVKSIGHHSLQLIFRSQDDIAKFKAAHGIKGEA